MGSSNLHAMEVGAGGVSGFVQRGASEVYR